MNIQCYTSFSFSYLGKARVLAKTLKQHHPDWILWAVITDREPEGFKFDLDREQFDRVIWVEELFGTETTSWLFNHDIVEACTAVKGRALELILETGAEKVFYLDPDIAVLGSLEPMVDWLDNSSILLTPHMVAPEQHVSAIMDNEFSSLRLGIYNLGFIAIRNDKTGKNFASWWANRLRSFCYDEPTSGLFVDQKWCDLVPALFDNVKVIRDPGYNVASWNLSNRIIDITIDGQILVNSFPIRFFHFTKLGPIGEMATQRYARDNFEVYEIWAWYRREIEKHSEPAIPSKWWYFGQFDNGKPIPKFARELYRSRKDLRAAFPSPAATVPPSYYDWLVVEHGLRK